MTQRLRREVLCPSCWHVFDIDRVLFIASANSADSLGDMKLGEMALTRFRPGAYNKGGQALDFSGNVTSDIACPRCHLEMGRALLSYLSFQVSVVGAQQCGKSYFLATMIREFRNTSYRYGFSFRDAHTRLNQAVHEYEQKLFFHDDRDAFVELAKTDRNAMHLHRSVLLHGQESLFPVPLQFHLERARDAADSGSKSPEGRVLVIYDNAGEHYEAQQTPAYGTATEHIGKSNAVFFVFDPTQDPRVLEKLGAQSPQQASSSPAKLIPRQDLIFTEMTARIRELRHVGPSQPVPVPLVVILTKSDQWAQPLSVDVGEEPFVELQDGRLALDHDRIARTSEACRDVLKMHCPDFWALVRSFSSEALFIPVSALGHTPQWIDDERRGGYFGVRPRDIQPSWVTVPILWAASTFAPELSL